MRIRQLLNGALELPKSKNNRRKFVLSDGNIKMVVCVTQHDLAAGLLPVGPVQIAFANVCGRVEREACQGEENSRQNGNLLTACG
jgi:hypothetical protein